MKRFLRDVVMFSLLALFAAEIGLRTIVPASMTPETTQDREFHILHFDTTAVREGIYTNGRLARDRVHWRVNDQGWNSPLDAGQVLRSGRSLGVIIGDSYVEGLYVDVDSSIAARVDRAVGDDLAVMGLGKSGLNLAQCIPVTRYAVARLRPDFVVIMATSGGIARSLASEVSRPYNLQYIEQDGRLTPRGARSYESGPLRKMLRLSALARYLRLNVGLRIGPGAVVQAAVAGDSVDPDLEAKKKEAAELIVAGLVEAAGRAKLVIVCDGNRRALAETGRRPAPLDDASLLGPICQRKGVPFVDLTDAFWAAQTAGLGPFQSVGNYHWNDEGLSVVASAVAGAF